MAAARSDLRVGGISDPIWRTTSPARAGFYWAKWLIAERDVHHGPALISSNDWDVVYVFENTVDKREGEFLRVLVVGVEGTQSIENFEWGPGPLTPPQ